MQQPWNLHWHNAECVSDDYCATYNEECIQWTCVNHSCARHNSSVETGCDSGNPELINNHCDGAGKCIGTNAKCLSDANCIIFDDQCFNYSCTNHVCTRHNRTYGVACDDHNNATVDDICDGEGTCIGRAVPCSTTNDCMQYNGECYVYECVDHECLIYYNETGSICHYKGNINRTTDRCDGAGTCLIRCETTPNCASLNDQCSFYHCVNKICVPYRLLDAPCTNGDLHTIYKHCDENGHCIGLDDSCTTNATCYEFNTSCVTAMCVNQHCVLTPKADSTVCNDGDNTTTGDHCVHGLCEGYKCTMDSECRNLTQNLCDVSMCQNGACLKLHRIDDMYTCRGPPPPNTSHAFCDYGMCVPASCVSNSECPDDSFSCVLLAGCYDGVCHYIKMPINTTCDDGNPATAFDVCMSRALSWGCHGTCCHAITDCPAPQSTCTKLVDCLWSDVDYFGCVYNYSVGHPSCTDVYGGRGTCQDDGYCQRNCTTVADCPPRNYDSCYYYTCSLGKCVHSLRDTCQIREECCGDHAMDMVRGVCA